jgi:hypothetical protein
MFGGLWLNRGRCSISGIHLSARCNGSTSPWRNSSIFLSALLDLLPCFDLSFGHCSSSYPSLSDHVSFPRRLGSTPSFSHCSKYASFLGTVFIFASCRRFHYCNTLFSGRSALQPIFLDPLAAALDLTLLSAVTPRGLSSLPFFGCHPPR